MVRGDGYPVAGGNWTQLCVGVLNHGMRSRSPSYTWVLSLAMCGDKDMATISTLWSKYLEVRLFCTSPAVFKCNSSGSSDLNSI